MNQPAAAAGAPGQQASEPKFTMKEFMDLMKFPMTAGELLDQDLGLRLGWNPPPAGHPGPQGAAEKGGIPNHQHQDRGCLMMTGQTLWCPCRGTAFSGMLSALPEASTRQ